MGDEVAVCYRIEPGRALLERVLSPFEVKRWLYTGGMGLTENSKHCYSCGRTYHCRSCDEHDLLASGSLR